MKNLRRPQAGLDRNASRGGPAHPSRGGPVRTFRGGPLIGGQWLQQRFWAGVGSGGGGRGGGGQDSARRQQGPALKFISQQVSIQSFCRSQLPDKSINLPFIFFDIKSKLAYLCRNWLLQKDFINTLRGIKVGGDVPRTQRANLSIVGV